MADLSTWAADWTQEQASPSFLVDSAKASVIAANAPALSLLGLSSDRALPLALDSTMPAITRLRLLARTGQTESPLDRLTFWIDGSVRQLDCQIRALKNGATGPHLYQVVLIEPTPVEIWQPTRSDIETKSISVSATPTLLEDQEPPRIKRDDNETLKEIARRIRETEVSWGISGSDTQSNLEDVKPVIPTSQLELHQPAIDDFSAQLSSETSVAQVETPSDVQQTLNKPADIDLAKLAHELKTPIGAIATASEVMRDERLGALGSSVYRDYAADIHNSAKHALDVINATLNRAQTGARQNEIQTIELNNLVSGAVSSLKSIAVERELDLSFDADPISPIVVTNPTAVRQIVLNLLTNALKYTPQGGVVRAATGYLDDGAVFVVVRDTGIGFDPDAPKVAIPGKSSRASASGRLEGSNGIGLPLVHQLAEGIGAGVEIDSAPGRGTVALLAFPRSASSY